MFAAKKNPKVSVIIPTYNEEKWLPNLLTCLKQQSFRDFEVIVADNHSTDATRAIARKSGARVVDGGLPSRGRNQGARVAKGDILFFADADIQFPENFLESAVAEFEKKHCGVATTYTTPSSRNIFDHGMYIFCNACFFCFQFFCPLAHGFNIFVKRDVFMATGGFDESLVAGEDFEFSIRAGRGRRFRVLSSAKNLASMRRFDKVGRLKHGWHLTKLTFRLLFLGHKLRSKRDYDWSGY